MGSFYRSPDQYSPANARNKAVTISSLAMIFLSGRKYTKEPIGMALQQALAGKLKSADSF